MNKIKSVIAMMAAVGMGVGAAMAGDSTVAQRGLAARGARGRDAAMARIGAMLCGSCNGASGVSRSNAASRSGVTNSGR